MSTDGLVTTGKKGGCRDARVSDGKCVVLGKGKRTDDPDHDPKDCRYIINHDTFKWKGSVPPSEPGESGWYTCWDYKNCEPWWEDLFSKGVSDNYEFYRDEIGEHEILYAIPLKGYAGVYSVEFNSSGEKELISLFYDILQAIGVPLKNLNSKQAEFINSDTHAVLVIDDPMTQEDRWSLTYAKYSGKVMFFDLKLLSELGIAKEKLDVSFEDKAKSISESLMNILSLKFGRNREISLPDIGVDLVETVMPTLSDEYIENLDDSEIEYETWVDFISVVFPLSLEGLYTGGKVEVYIKPNLWAPTGIIIKYRKVGEEPIEVIDLPNLETLRSVADAKRVEYCVEGLPCTLKLLVGYDDADINAKKDVLEPAVIISYDAALPENDSESGVDVVPVRKIKNFAEGRSNDVKSYR